MRQSARLLYKYRPLETSQSIRVIVLHPAEHLTDSLVCDVVHHDRREISKDITLSNHYEAVSYAWGEPRFSHEIICDNGTAILNITSSVDSVLRYLRKKSRPRYLWIDAISLNQADNDEKSVQVQLMREIYHQAAKVRIWLGNADGQDVRKVFAFLRSLLILKTDQITGQTIHDLVFDIWGEISSKPIEQFLHRSWFQRRWVLQEAALSHDATVHCDLVKIGWQWLLDGLEALQVATEVGFELDHEALKALKNVCMLRSNSGKILDLLWGFDAAECSDPRDRLFSLWALAKDITTDPTYHYDPQNRSLHPLGLIKDGQSPNTRRIDATMSLIHLSVDYVGSWTESYSLFTTECIKAGYFMDILQHLMAFGSLARRNENLPSWVPDYSSPRRLEPLTDWIPLTDHREDFGRILPVTLPRGQTLAIIAAKVGEIQRVSTNWSSVSTWKDIQLLISDLLDDIYGWPGHGIEALLCAGIAAMTDSRYLEQDLRKAISGSLSVNHLDYHVSRLVQFFNGTTEQLRRLGGSYFSPFYIKLSEDSFDAEYISAIQMLMEENAMFVSKRRDGRIYIGIGPCTLRDDDEFVLLGDYVRGFLFSKPVQYGCVLRSTGKELSESDMGFAGKVRAHTHNLLGPCLYISTVAYNNDPPSLGLALITLPNIIVV
jgi:heterokaryon incompatibility protein (HET)